MMIGIILGVLKVLGLVLLGILGVVVFLLLVVLFVPIRYNIEIEAYNKIDSIKGNGKVKWLLGLFRARIDYSYPELNWDAYFFWIQLNPEKRMQKNTKTKNEDRVKLISEPNSHENEIQDTDKIKRKKDNKQLNEQSRKKSKKKKEKRNFKKKISSICDTIKMLIEKKEKVVEFYYQEEHQYTIAKCKKLLVYLFRKLRPKVFSVRARFGFEDPSITGKVLAVLGVLYPFYRNTIEVVPDFDEVVYDGDLKVKGKIRSYYFVLILIRLIIDKQVRVTYEDIKSFEL